jgi:hypothetical protein
MSRSQYFAAVAALCCVNGLTSRIITAVDHLGWLNAIFVTFEVSAIVWVACILGVQLVLRGREEPIRNRDLAFGALLLIPIALPIGGLSWLALALLGLYILLFAAPSPEPRRGAIILVAVTVPMLWTKLLFKYFAHIILQIDASLVALLLGTPRVGNMVRFVDDSGSLVILPYCSSLANVSLAFLTWVVISQWVDHRLSSRDWQWCVLAAVSVVAINVTRMGIMGLSEGHYHAIHSLWGDTLTNLLILCATLGICLFGVRRELAAHA